MTAPDVVGILGFLASVASTILCVYGLAKWRRARLRGACQSCGRAP